jgi:hypothetical protein
VLPDESVTDETDPDELFHPTATTLRFAAD